MFGEPGAEGLWGQNRGWLFYQAGGDDRGIVCLSAVEADGFVPPIRFYVGSQFLLKGLFSDVDRRQILLKGLVSEGVEALFAFKENTAVLLDVS